MKVINKKIFSRKPKAILIDIDNTLYAYEPAHKSAIAAVAEKLNLELSIDRRIFTSHYESARIEVKQRLGKTASSHSRLLYMQMVLERLGLGTQPLLCLDMEQTYWRAFLRHATLFDNVMDFLDDCRVVGVPVVAVTDLTSQIQFRKLVYFGIDHFFQFVVTSEESGCDKPGSASFLLALQKCDVKEGLVWMIGDDLAKDISGAKDSINAATLHKVSGFGLPSSESEADAIFRDFKELRAFLDALASDVW